MTGLSEAEARVVRALVEAWNAYLELPVDHQEGLDEFRRGIHALQNQVFARPAIADWNAATLAARALPDTVPRAQCGKRMVRREGGTLARYPCTREQGHAGACAPPPPPSARG